MRAGTPNTRITLSGISLLLTHRFILVLSEEQLELRRLPVQQEEFVIVSVEHSYIARPRRGEKSLFSPGGVLNRHPNNGELRVASQPDAAYVPEISGAPRREVDRFV